MPLSPAVIERLVQIAQAAAEAGHGRKEAVYAAACAELGMSRATLMRHLATTTVRADRKRRSDAGDVALPQHEAELISALLMESHRKNNKRLLSIGQAVTTLRANGLVRAEACDADGVLRPLSDSAIARALRRYALHPDQLLRPAPATELRSLHPNHVWQIDASLCVLYYLHANTPREAGLQVMRHDHFYKNKPANLKRIESDRVWSYEATDHYSSSIGLNYVLGAESGMNLAESFIEFIQCIDGQPMHGVPLITMMDMGSANTGGLFKALARRLDMRVIAHSAGNARATGQVEKARDIIERSFESALKLRPVADLAELNAAARMWAQWFNSTKVHSRHGQTRYAMWQTITAEQLRLAPSRELCRELMTHAPEERTVTDQLRVPFKGYGDFDVRDVPGVMVGAKLQVTYNPYDLVDGRLGSAMVLGHDADGNEVLHRAPLVAKDEAGFAITANVIGEDWARPRDTLADTNRKLVERIATGTTTDDAAAAARKAKAVPFGGKVDPYKHIADTPTTTWLPKRGTPLVPTTTVAGASAAARVLTLFEAATELARRGVAMSPERNAQVRGWHPEGVPEDAMDDLVRRLQVRAGLRVVGRDGTTD